jgi:hypothetical protein
MKTLIKLVVANAVFAIVNNLNGSRLSMDIDTKRAMNIIAHEYNFDAKELEALIREYSCVEKESYGNDLSRIYPSPREIAYKFIEWLKNEKQMNPQKNSGSLNRL